MGWALPERLFFARDEKREKEHNEEKIKQGNDFFLGGAGRGVEIEIGFSFLVYHLDQFPFIVSLFFASFRLTS